MSACYMLMLPQAFPDCFVTQQEALSREQSARGELGQLQQDCELLRSQLEEVATENQDLQVGGREGGREGGGREGGRGGREGGRREGGWREEGGRGKEEGGKGRGVRT